MVRYRCCFQRRFQVLKGLWSLENRENISLEALICRGTEHWCRERRAELDNYRFRTQRHRAFQQRFGSLSWHPVQLSKTICPDLNVPPKFIQVNREETLSKRQRIKIAVQIVQHEYQVFAHHKLRRQKSCPLSSRNAE